MRKYVRCMYSLIVVLCIILSACNGAKRSESEKLKWYNAEPITIDNISFSEPTETDVVDFVELQVPSTWRKKHEPDSTRIYYYPFDNTSKTFILCNSTTCKVDFDSMDEETYRQKWPTFIESFIEGMEKAGQISNSVATPLIVNGNKSVIIKGDYSNNDNNTLGMIYSAIFTSHEKMVTISALMADPNSNLSLDEYYAVLCSVKMIEELDSGDQFVSTSSAEPEFSLASNQNDNSVYSSNGITVKLGQSEYDKSWGGYYFTDLSVKNESVSDIYFEVEYVKVNGFQLPVFTYGNVYSGMESTLQVSLSPDDMKLAHIDHILEVEMCVRLSESENYKSIIGNPILSLKTPDAEKYTQSYDFGWQDVYNEKGIHIFARLGGTEESYPVVFYIDNNSGKTVSISYNDIAVNNTMVGQMMTGAQVVNGAKCVTGMQRPLLEMMGGSVPKNKDINSLVLKFSILPIGDNGSFSTEDMYYSEKIVVLR